MKGNDMNWFVFAITTLIAALIQGGNLLNFASFTEYTIKPDLLIILLIFICIYAEPSKAVAASFFIGFAADIITPAMGPNMVSYVIVASLLTTFQRVLRLNDLLLDSGLIFITALITASFSSVISCFTTDISCHHFLFRLFATALYTAILGPFIWLLLRAYSRFLGLKIKR